MYVILTDLVEVTLTYVHNYVVFRSNIFCLLPIFCRRFPLGNSNSVSLHDRLKENFDVSSHSESAATVVIIPGENGSGEKVEHSALSYRQSYFQDMPLPAPRPLLLNRPANFREKKVPNSNARTRPIRLRPRHPLCSKCRSKCGTNFTASTSHNSGEKSDKPSFIKKHKADSALPKNLSSKRSITTGENLAAVRKTSPVIKISYASPQGKGHVVRIPAKTHSTAYKNSTTLNQNHRLCQNDRQNTQKVLKKAKSSVKTLPKSKTNKPLVNGFHHGNGPKSYHEQHRRIRIIKSKGTYHSASANQSGNVKNIESSQVNNQTLSASATLSSGKTGKIIGNSLHLCAKTTLEEPAVQNSDAKVSVPTFDSSTQYSNHSKVTSRRIQKDEISTDNLEVCSVIEGDSNVPIVSILDQEVSLLIENHKPVLPLKMQVHKKNVTKSCLQDGREMCIGDIVWGKITGFPWWPGRIVEIVVSRYENGTLLSQLAQITWFASTTISHMPLTELYPFLPFFTERYNRKKKGIYRDAVRQATEAATTLSAEVRALNTMFETSTLQP